MSQEQKGAENPLIQWTAGKIQELMGALHPEDEALVLEYLGYSKLDAGTIDPPPEITKKKSVERTNEALADERTKR
jgi:hypothetical protein